MIRDMRQAGASRQQKEADLGKTIVAGSIESQQTIIAATSAPVFTPVQEIRAMATSKDDSSKTRDIENYNLIMTLKAHPILADVWATYRTGDDWAEQMDEWLVDDMVDAYFDSEALRPKREQYETDFDYQTALVQWLRDREAYLDAHPQVAERLLSGRNEVEISWKHTELMWSETVLKAAEAKLEILRETAKGADADREPRCDRR